MQKLTVFPIADFISERARGNLVKLRDAVLQLKEEQLENVTLRMSNYCSTRITDENREFLQPYMGKDDRADEVLGLTPREIDDIRSEGHLHSINCQVCLAGLSRWAAIGEGLELVDDNFPGYIRQTFINPEAEDLPFRLQFGNSNPIRHASEEMAENRDKMIPHWKKKEKVRSLRLAYAVFLFGAFWPSTPEASLTRINFALDYGLPLLDSVQALVLSVPDYTALFEDYRKEKEADAKSIREEETRKD